MKILLSFVFTVFLSGFFSVTAQHHDKTPKGNISLAQAIIDSQKSQKDSNSLLSPYRIPDVLQTTLPDYIILSMWWVETSEWFPYERMDYQYENEVYTKEILYSSIVGEELIPMAKEVIIYNDKWIEQEREIYMAAEETGSWVSSEKYLTHTDDQDNMILEAELAWNAEMSRWDTITGTRTAYVYKTNGVVETETIYYFEGTAWIPSIQNEMVYDTQGRLFYLTENEWDIDAEAFTAVWRDEYIYNEQNEWSEVLRYEHFDEEWLLSAKTADYEWLDFLQQKALAFIEYNYELTEESWVPSMRNTFEYNSNQEQTLMLSESYDTESEQWAPAYRETTQFDDAENLLLYTMEMHDGETWIIFLGIRNKYTYDSFGMPDEVVVEFYDGEGAQDWVNFLKMKYGYDGGSVDIRELAHQDELVKLYPNPTSGRLNIDAANGTEVSNVLIYNLSGQIVYQKEFSPSGIAATIELNHLKEGVYFATFISAEKRQVIKVVKR